MILKQVTGKILNQTVKLEKIYFVKANEFYLLTST